MNEVFHDCHNLWGVRSFNTCKGFGLKMVIVNAFHKCKLEGQKGRGIHVGVTGLY